MLSFNEDKELARWSRAEHASVAGASRGAAMDGAAIQVLIEKHGNTLGAPGLLVRKDPISKRN